MCDKCTVKCVKLKTLLLLIDTIYENTEQAKVGTVFSHNNEL